MRRAGCLVIAFLDEVARFRILLPRMATLICMEHLVLSLKRGYPKLAKVCENAEFEQYYDVSRQCIDPSLKLLLRQLTFSLDT